MCMKGHRRQVNELLVGLVDVTRNMKAHAGGCSKLWISPEVKLCLACHATPSYVLGLLYFLRDPAFTTFIDKIPLSKGEYNLLALVGTEEFARLQKIQVSRLGQFLKVKCERCSRITPLPVTLVDIKQQLGFPRSRFICVGCGNLICDGPEIIHAEIQPEKFSWAATFFKNALKEKETLSKAYKQKGVFNVMTTNGATTTDWVTLHTWANVDVGGTYNNG